MELLHLTLFLLLCSVALGWIARRYSFPYPIALVLGGGALGFVPRLPIFPIEPQILLALVLPPILYQAALLTSWHDFKASIRPIGALAIGLVIATTLAVGAALKLLIPDMPWAAAFVLGAIVSPPDAVAATTILSRLSIPRRVVTVLEGESLINDASGLVLYKFAVAATLTGTFSLAQAGTQFVLVSLGGVACGITLGFVFIAVHKRLDDAFVEVLTSLAVPYVAYILAESVHYSGVLAVVAAGLVRGRYSPEIVSSKMRILARSMWNILVFLLNSFIFILIGLQLSNMVDRLSGYGAAQLVMSGVLVSAVAIAVRFAWIYPVTWLPRLASARYRANHPAPPEGELFIMSWCGMRGIVSLAAALALPLTVESGAPFPQRDLIIFLTFVVIAVTLVVQGLSLAPLVRRLHVGSDRSRDKELREARASMAAAALAAIHAAAREAGIDAAIATRIYAEFAEKLTHTGLNTAPTIGGADLANRLRYAAIKAERAALIRTWREHRIGDEVLHHFEEILDYQETHL
jgi:monovalent cation/hydrogen antiporter